MNRHTLPRALFWILVAGAGPAFAGSDLPPLRGLRGQLIELLVNGVTNAMESLDAIADRARRIEIRTMRPSHDRVSIVIEEPDAVAALSDFCRELNDRAGGASSELPGDAAA